MHQGRTAVQCHGREGRVSGRLDQWRSGYLDVINSVGLEVDPLVGFDAQHCPLKGEMGTKSGDSLCAWASICSSLGPRLPSVWRVPATLSAASPALHSVCTRLQG